MCVCLAQVRVPSATRLARISRSDCGDTSDVPMRLQLARYCLAPTVKVSEAVVKENSSTICSADSHCC